MATNGAGERDEETGLRYVNDTMPGIRRRRAGTGFSYVNANGKRVSDAVRARIEALKIPPAWEEVWICPHANGHIQAMGTDAKGRRQYLYHPKWRLHQDADKFDRIVAFARALPGLRDHVRADLMQPGLPRAKVVAAIVRAMDLTFMRVGSACYAKENESYGMSTLETEHLVMATSRHVSLRFPAKGGKVLEVELEDRRVVDVIIRCQDLPGQRLFEYVDDDGEVHDVDSGDVNEYLRDATGEDFTSKDFRTWAASALMASILAEAEQDAAKTERERIVREAVKEVAERLGNTPAVCKKSYIHPAIPAAYLDGTLWKRMETDETVRGLWPEERLTLAVLESYGEGPTT